MTAKQELLKFIILFKSLIALGLITVFITPAYADLNHPLIIKMVNNTNETFLFDGVEGQNPTNIFIMKPSKILPHQTATIIASSSLSYDLAGHILLKDSIGTSICLEIFDYRQFHPMNLIADINTDEYKTIKNSEKRNPDTGPLFLSWSAAKITLEPKR